MVYYGCLAFNFSNEFLCIEFLFFQNILLKESEFQFKILQYFVQTLGNINT
jgi:hypothetical protein